MPANGGPERIVTQTQGDVWPIVWAKHDSIYFGISFFEKENAAKNGVYRVSVAGGKPELVLKTADWGTYPGLSRDGRLIVGYVPTWDTLVVATPSGRRLNAYGASGADVPATPDVWSSAGKAVGSRPLVMNCTNGGTSMRQDHRRQPGRNVDVVYR